MTIRVAHSLGDICAATPANFSHRAPLKKKPHPHAPTNSPDISAVAVLCTNATTQDHDGVRYVSMLHGLCMLEGRENDLGDGRRRREGVVGEMLT
jgi:hypothetical protein